MFAFARVAFRTALARSEEESVRNRADGLCKAGRNRVHDAGMHVVAHEGSVFKVLRKSSERMVAALAELSEGLLNVGAFIIFSSRVQWTFGDSCFVIMSASWHVVLI